MKNVDRIADDLYIIKQPIREGWFCGIILVIGERKIGLVDTGFENTPAEYIFPLINELDRRSDEIDYVVNTHRDRDHIGGNKVVKETTCARIAVHELEAEAVDIADIILKDRDVVELGDRRFEVIHTPGHRPGSICLYDHKNYTLITGDSICGERRNLIRMDKEIYIKSLKKLLDLDIRLMIMAHPFQPYGKSVLTGREAEEMIKTSISIAEKLN